VNEGHRPETSAEGSEATCVIARCGGLAVRSLPRSEVRKVFPTLSEAGRRAPLCRDHYKEWKKATKEARKLDRLAW
jgi:putative heme degradation protein